MTRNMKTKTTAPAYGGADMESLMLMLETKRPHKSKAEKKFIADFIEPLGVERDGFGNLYKRVEGIGDDVLWSIHTDTVHHSGGRQLIRKQKGMIRLNPKSKANCLGADDTAGIWLAREMIAAGKPGLYVFHRAEECGGLGSDFIATHNVELLTGIKIAIALDRKGYGDVITHQMERGCSNAFADSLCAGLNKGHNLEFSPDDTGLFTDTANYFTLIPECTNISVGYFGNHSSREYQDSEFLVSLRAALIALDTSKLIVERNPKDSYYDDFDPNDSPTPSLDRGLSKFDSLVSLHSKGGWSRYDNEHVEEESPDTNLIRAIRDNPETIAQILEDYGIGIDEILQSVYDKTGNIPF